MKDQLLKTEALLERLKKELDGKLERGSQTSKELEELIEEIRSAHRQELSKAQKSALASKSLYAIGTLVRLLPEIAEWLKDLG